MFGDLFDTLSSGFNAVYNGVSSIANSAMSLFSSKTEEKGVSDPKVAETVASSNIAASESKKNLEARYKDTLEPIAPFKGTETAFTKPSLPTPSEHDLQCNEKTPPSLIIAKLMARAQKTVQETEEPAMLKLSAVDKKLTREKKNLRNEEKKILDKQKQANEWSEKTRVANYLVSGTSFLTGAGMLASGIPAGAIIMTGAGGSFASQLMQDYGFSSNLVKGVSIASGLLGLAGGVSSLWNAPQTLASGLSSIVTTGASVFSTLAGAFQAYTGYKTHENLSEVMKLEALHTLTEVKVRSLLDKLPSTTTIFQNATKSLSSAIKSIAKAHNRSTTALRVAGARIQA